MYFGEIFFSRIDIYSNLIGQSEKQWKLNISQKFLRNLKNPGNRAYFQTIASQISLIIQYYTKPGSKFAIFFFPDKYFKSYLY